MKHRRYDSPSMTASMESLANSLGDVFTNDSFFAGMTSLASKCRRTQRTVESILERKKSVLGNVFRT